MPSIHVPLSCLLWRIGFCPSLLQRLSRPRSKVPSPDSLECGRDPCLDRPAHPLLKGAGTEKVMARGKMLKALGAFEPTVVNDTELERFISSSNPAKGTQTVGFNDTIGRGSASLGI